MGYAGNARLSSLLGLDDSTHAMAELSLMSFRKDTVIGGNCTVQTPITPETQAPSPPLPSQAALTNLTCGSGGLKGNFGPKQCDHVMWHKQCSSRVFRVAGDAANSETQKGLRFIAVLFEP